jgi:anti-sigma regulatory factor (Ser/Thr protein kinase)
VGTAAKHDLGTREVSELCLPAQPWKLGVARAYAHTAAARFGLDDDRCHEFAFAVNEAVTNAIRHGAPDEQGRIHLTAMTSGDCLTIAVRDYGRFAAPATDAHDAERGRGFALMGRLMDCVQLCVAADGTTVLLTKARTSQVSGDAPATCGGG